MQTKLIYAITVLMMLLLTGGVAHAFDTGPHSDLTREALAEVGMSNTAIQVCQVENWLVDYYSVSPTSPSEISRETAKLHADNLFSQQAVTNYWDRYAVNAKKAFNDAARSNDPKKVLALLGMSLHTVQDFYSHSNWPEIQPISGADYATNTWFDTARRDGVRTGRASSNPDTSQQEHGSYSSGMNHDEPGRPNWDRAYVFAYTASRQWVNQAMLWVKEVNPAVWEQAKNIALTPTQSSRLASDFNASYRLSEWATTGGNDGHWKGKGSGSSIDFIPFSAGWIALTLDSIFVEDFKNRHWHQLLSGGLNDALDLGVNAPPSSPAPAIARISLHKKAVYLRTLFVKDINNVDSVLGIGGNADFFAKITIQNQMFTEAMQLDKPTIRPVWTTIKFVPDDQTSAIVHYELWDEDTVNDDHLDISPLDRPGARQGDVDYNLDFFYNMTTHQMGGIDIEGVFDSPNQLFVRKGTAKNRAEVQFYITTKTLAEPASIGKRILTAPPGGFQVDPGKIK
jgi:hypothetical protein